MKKIKLFYLLIFLTLSASAQEYLFHSSQVRYREYDTDYQKWGMWSDWENCNVSGIIKSNMIIVNDYRFKLVDSIKKLIKKNPDGSTITEITYQAKLIGTSFLETTYRIEDGKPVKSFQEVKAMITVTYYSGNYNCSIDISYDNNAKMYSGRIKLAPMVIPPTIEELLRKDKK